MGNYDDLAAEFKANLEAAKAEKRQETTDASDRLKKDREVVQTVAKDIIQPELAKAKQDFANIDIRVDVNPKTMLNGTTGKNEIVEIDLECKSRNGLDCGLHYVFSTPGKILVLMSLGGGYTPYSKFRDPGEVTATMVNTDIRSFFAEVVKL